MALKVRGAAVCSWVAGQGQWSLPGLRQEQASYPALIAFRDIEGCEPPPSVVDAIVERFLVEIRAPHNEVAAAPG
jgi:hypothetical protein